MRIFEATITSKGRMTLPTKLRNRLHLKAGDRVEFYEDWQGHLFLRPRNTSPTAFFESLPARKRLSQVKNDEDAIVKAVSQRDKRSRSADVR